MKISLSRSPDLWWGVFHDRNRGVTYFAPLPHWLITIAWAPQYEHGHLANQRETVARRERLSGQVEVLASGWESWRPIHAHLWPNFRAGSAWRAPERKP